MVASSLNTWECLKALFGCLLEYSFPFGVSWVGAQGIIGDSFGVVMEWDEQLEKTQELIAGDSRPPIHGKRECRPREPSLSQLKV